MADTKPEQKFDGLNDDLLKASEECKTEQEIPKKVNSKQGLIDKIVKISEDQNIPLEHSMTKLKRMAKKDLARLLAEMIEKLMRKEMCRQVGVDEGSDQKVVALGALRMVHDIFAKGAEEGLNRFLPQYGYEVNGFCENLQNPNISKQIDAALAEIAEENDVLQYIQSPYSRLALAWFGGLSMSVRKKAQNNNRTLRKKNAPVLEPRTAAGTNPIQLGPLRRQTAGQIDRRERPAQPATHVV